MALACVSDKRPSLTGSSESEPSTSTVTGSIDGGDCPSQHHVLRKVCNSISNRRRVSSVHWRKLQVSVSPDRSTNDQDTRMQHAVFVVANAHHRLCNSFSVLTDDSAVGRNSVLQHDIFRSVFFVTSINNGASSAQNRQPQVPDQQWISTPGSCQIAMRKQSGATS